MTRLTSHWVEFLPSSWSSSLPSVQLLGGRWEEIVVDKDFIEFLKEDGLVLDEVKHSSQSSWSDEEDEWEDQESSNSTSREIVTPSKRFPDLHDQILDSIRRLGGCVVPKLNWTVPTDAIWISANTLKCTSADDIYTLFKSSDRIQSDLALSSECELESHVILLRSYANIEPEYEFNCFVRNGNLLAIAQKNLEVYNSFLSEQRPTIEALIKAFYKQIKHRLSFDSCNIFSQWISYCFRLVKCIR